MNDLGNRNWHGAITSDHQDGRPLDRRTASDKSRPGAWRQLASGLALGAWSRYLQQQQVMATAEHMRDLVPRVRVATVEPSPGIISVVLPGTTAAFADANIYARATGYTVKRNVDIGDHVKQGELLTEIAVPELDDQILQNEATLAQLKAGLEQVQATLKLAQMTWERDRPLVKEGWVTQQQGTTDVQTLRAQEANLAAAQHNVSAQENLLKMLRRNRGYANVVAPFDGVITQRNVDVGTLVQGNINSGTFLFEIMQTDVIRVFVYVPQDAAFGVVAGIDAVVRVPEIPDREFVGKVTRTAEALQSGTRTLLTEIDLANPEGALPPGIYCTVELRVPRRTPSFVVPADAIIFSRDGLQVAVFNNGRAEFRKLAETRDLGTRVEVDAGVKAGERVILQPPVTLDEGSKVVAAQ